MIFRARRWMKIRGTWQERLDLFPVEESWTEHCGAPNAHCILLSSCNVLLGLNLLRHLNNNNHVRWAQHNIVQSCFHQAGTTCVFSWVG